MKQRLLVLAMLAVAGCGHHEDPTAPNVGVLTVTPGSYDFQDTYAGGSSPRVTFTVTNTGFAATGIVDVTLGADASDFGIYSNDCASAGSLNVGASCTFKASFNPTGPAGVRIGSIIVQAPPPTGSAAIAIWGNVLPPLATVSLSPATHHYTYSGNFDFTVTNTGGAASGTPSVFLSGPNAGNFAVLTNGCTASIAAGASCVIRVRFNGLDGSGYATALLNVAFQQGSVAPARLFGQAL